MIDDSFMTAVFDGRIPETSVLIETILERKDISLVSVKSQFHISNLYGKEIRLDILSKDNTGKTYHFEVQRDIEGASAQRARFTGALIDTTLLNKGQKYEDMSERYTIFITEKDIFHKNIPLYHVEYKIEELDNLSFGDGSHIIYVNGTFQDLNTQIGQLMHDFFCDKANDIINPVLRERVRYLKETEGGRKEMCEIMENLINEEKIELAKNAIAKGNLSVEEIADVLDLPLTLVRELAQMNTVCA